ncbi:MalY/PatB family protein [Lactobacillus xujianguonis]|uniref:MalY/PatB family protein n=1 Tax=Lactobacillus xujianguonis TaxID=2495899 RepID=UPI000FD6ECAC|nr:MalY/PatB family protein [Lactobacillus xujianguonis]RVU74101.1 pyridoxal phosphate-dependent aminotransferase [Lactobacillus xujianguonis]
MKYDFENAPDRSQTDSVKWDVQPGELPMWIADMDFKTAPEIVTAMQQKIALGAFGYEWPQADYFKAVADWYESEHHQRPELEWMIFTTGVVPAISSIVRRVSHIGDNVLVQEPVYNIFYNSILNNGRHVLSSDLVFDGEEYHIDWADLDKKMADPLTTLMIFCNPHNPIGKVWTRDEVQRIADLCAKHHVVLLSDEIHGDLVREGQDYTPAFAVKDASQKQSISLVSPSKTFNVAALHAATAIVPNENLRNMVNRGLNSDEVAEPNLLAIPATIAAYEHGHAWLQELKQQLRENFAYASDFIQKNLPAIQVIKGTATYLLWLDTAQVAADSELLADFIRKETGLIVSAGNIYRGNGRNFIRINLACPLKMVKDGMQRLATGINKYNN